MWDALFDAAQGERQTVKEICTKVNRTRKESTLTSGLRVYILRYFRRAAKRR